MAAKKKIELVLEVTTSSAQAALKAFERTASTTAGKVEAGFNAIGRAGKSLLGVLKDGQAAFAIFAGSQIVSGIQRVGAAFINLAKEGANFVGLKQSFTSLYNSMAVGSKTAAEALEDMRAATKGAVNDMDLLKNANQAMLLGIKPDKLAEMMEIATATAEATGQSINFMTESMILGIGRQSKMIIDNLGITIDVAKANEVYAKSIGKTADSLTDAEKKQAFMNAVIEKGQANMAKLRGETDASLAKYVPFNVQLDKINTRFENMRITLGTKLAPAMSIAGRSFEEFMDRMEEASGKTDGGAFNGIVKSALIAQGAVQGVFRAIAEMVKNQIEGWQGMWNALAKFGNASIKVMSGDLDGAKKLMSGFGTDMKNYWKAIDPVYMFARSGEIIAEEVSKAKEHANNLEAVTDKLNKIKDVKGPGAVDETEQQKAVTNKYLEELNKRRAFYEHYTQTRAMADSAMYEGNISRIIDGTEINLKALEESMGAERATDMLRAEMHLKATGREKERAELIKKMADTTHEYEKKKLNERLQMYSTVTSQLGNMFGQLASIQNKNTAEGQRRHKALMKAQIIASTAAASIEAYRAAQILPFPLNHIMGTAGIATAVAVGAHALNALESSSVGFSLESAVNNAIENKKQEALQGANKQVEARVTGGIPMAAEGALIKGTPKGSVIIAGENNKSEAIIPLENPEAMNKLGGAGGGINIVINGNVYDSDRLPEKLVEGIDMALRNRTVQGRSLLAAELR